MNKSLIAIASLCLMAAASSCGKGDKSATAETVQVAEEKPNVEIERVHLQAVPQTVTYTATVQAFKTNNISTSTPNRIKEILVEVGDKVKRGQRLVLLDNATVAQLKIRLDNTERDYNRAVQLLEIGGGTRQTVDQLKTELDAARRQYENVVENTVLVSPVNGVVTARNYDAGDMTSALPILTVEQLQPVKVIISVSENEFTKVHLGMKAEVYLDVYGDERFEATVALIHPTVDAATRTFTVELNIANRDERVRPGMFARVIMDYGSAEHIVVPDRAIVKQTGSGEKFVYVYKDGRVSFNRVEVGQRLGNTYELLSGVDNGADVVIAGQSRLADGVEVNILSK